jgi:RNA polymerase II subunit A-like phosphatase
VLTHVVAAKDGTDKILAARKLPGCRIVKPGWLMECVWSLTRREEGRYLLGDAPPRFSELRTPLSEYSTAKENSSSELDDDSEDDDLAAQFESELMEEEEYV